MSKIDFRFSELRSLIDQLWAKFGGITPTVVTAAQGAAGGAGTGLPSATPTTVLSRTITTLAGGGIVATAHIAVTSVNSDTTAVELLLEVDGVAIDVTTETLNNGVDSNVTLTGKASGLSAGSHTVTVVGVASTTGASVQAGGATGCTITALATTS